MLASIVECEKSQNVVLKLQSKMKQEDIDKKIGMPDVDAEWAKFEREVIGQPRISRKPLYWAIGIAASIALIAGIFLLDHDTEEQQQAIAKQTTPTKQIVSAKQANVDATEEPVTLPEKVEPVRIETKQHPSSDLLAQATPTVNEETVYDCGEVMPQFPGGDLALKEFIKTNLKYPDLAMEYGAKGRVMMTFKVDSMGYVSGIKVARCILAYDTLSMLRESEERQLALKEQIKSLMSEEGTRILSLMPQKWTPGSMFGKNVSVRYNVPIIFNITDAERKTYLAQKQAADEELQGRIAGLNKNDIPDSVRQARRDSLLRQREINMDSMLIVVNGTPIPLYKFNRKGIAPYLYKQHQLLSDGDLNVEERISRGVYTPYGGSEEERKRRCFEIYGDRAKYGVIEVTTVPDTYCDAYISKHPELKKERQHIDGYVYDEDNKPLADAWVNVRGKGIGAASDSEGYFSIWLPQTDVELMASHMGYVPSVIKTIKPMLTIRLRSATKIREVKVRGKRETLFK